MSSKKERNDLEIKETINSNLSKKDKKTSKKKKTVKEKKIVKDSKKEEISSNINSDKRFEFTVHDESVWNDTSRETKRDHKDFDNDLLNEKNRNKKSETVDNQENDQNRSSKEIEDSFWRDIKGDIKTNQVDNTEVLDFKNEDSEDTAELEDSFWHDMKSDIKSNQEDNSEVLDFKNEDSEDTSELEDSFWHERKHDEKLEIETSKEDNVAKKGNEKPKNLIKKEQKCKEKKKKQKRKRWKLKKIPLTIFLIFCIIVVWMFGAYLLTNNTDFSKKETSKAVVEKKVVVQKEDVDYEAKVFMVGDALIHSSIYLDAAQGDGSYDFKPMLQYIKPIVSKYDIAYYNQETILGGADLGYSNYPRFHTPDACGDAFVDAGFNMVSLATNHTMDKGEVGVLHSVEYWKQHPNVAASGQWSSYEEREESVAKVYEVNHIKYGFISYTIWTNGLETPYGKDYLNSLYSPEKAQADIASIRDKVDFVIVAMHWGTEYSWNVDWKQDEIANYLSELGVDLIIGAHPHVVQTVEYINDNKTFVVYSLGNFISDQLDVDNYTGLAMEVTLKKHVGTDGKVVNSVVDPKAQLIYTTVTQRRGWSSDFRVKTYPTLNDDELRNHETYYERYKAIVNQRYPDLTWGLTWE